MVNTAFQKKDSSNGMSIESLQDHILNSMVDGNRGIIETSLNSKID